jgi:cytidine deaminase
MIQKKMIKNKIIIEVEEFSSFEELESSDLMLLQEATIASETSYSPYSSFQVGAAVRLTGGSIIRGSNQENAAYPSGICAERVALFFAQSQYPEIPVEAIAIFAKSAEFKLDQPVTPCGSCRQVMAEVENRSGKKIRIIMGNNNSHVQIVEGIESLLPLMFMPEGLKKPKATSFKPQS